MTFFICPAVVEDQEAAAGYRCTLRECNCFSDGRGAGACWLDNRHNKSGDDLRKLADYDSENPPSDWYAFKYYLKTVLHSAADENELLRSMLLNARNILRDGGYVYALEIDKVLGAAPQKVE